MDYEATWDWLTTEALWWLAYTIAANAYFAGLCTGTLALSLVAYWRRWR